MMGIIGSVGNERGLVNKKLSKIVDSPYFPFYKEDTVIVQVPDYVDTISQLKEYVVREGARYITAASSNRIYAQDTRSINATMHMFWNLTSGTLNEAQMATLYVNRKSTLPGDTDPQLNEWEDWGNLYLYRVMSGGAAGSFIVDSSWSVADV